MHAADADASSPGLTTDQLVRCRSRERNSVKTPAAPIAGTKALDIFWDKRIREAGKMIRPSPLFPKSQRRLGKIQFNWLATSDLQSRWAGSLFVWAFLLVGVVSVAAAYSYAKAFVPAPLAKVHSEGQMVMVPAIARQPNAGACTSCHAGKGRWKTGVLSATRPITLSLPSSNHIRLPVSVVSIATQNTKAPTSKPVSERWRLVPAATTTAISTLQWQASRHSSRRDRRLSSSEQCLE